jgi:hypothetical protein
VVIGESKEEVKTADTKKLREPPINESTGNRYDSVKGNTNGSDVFMVY